MQGCKVVKISQRERDCVCVCVCARVCERKIKSIDQPADRWMVCILVRSCIWLPCWFSSSYLYPRYAQVFLLTHSCFPIGTSRPTCYNVIRDDSDMGADEIEMFTYALCFVYQRATKAVSIPAPIYYADLAAYRNRAYLSLINSGTGAMLCVLMMANLCATGVSVWDIHRMFVSVVVRRIYFVASLLLHLCLLSCSQGIWNVDTSTRHQATTMIDSNVVE